MRSERLVEAQKDVSSILSHTIKNKRMKGDNFVRNN